jgi:hypothetical protein
MSKKSVKFPCPTFLVSRNSEDSHQRNPSWVVAFVRFSEPASIYGKGVKNLEKVKDHILVIENDCIEVSTSSTKGAFGKNCSMTFKVGEVYYPNLVSPGDWVFVWMVDYQDDADTITRLLLNNRNGGGKLNDWYSGLKFAGRVISVDDAQSVQSGGTWNITQHVQAQAFLEFATSIYYTYLSKAFVTPRAGQVEGSTDATTQSAAAKIDPTNQARRMSNFLLRRGVTNLDDEFISLFESSQAKLSPDDMVQFLFVVIFGVDKDAVNLSNKSRGVFSDAISVPSQVAMILNQPNAKKLWQLYTVYLGLQKYSNSSKSAPWESFSPDIDEASSTGFDSGDDTVTNVFFRSPIRCTGWVPFFPPNWDNANGWEFLNRYVNSPFNEMYTALKVNHFNQIVPTLTVREVPFGTNLYDYLIPGKAINLTAGVDGDSQESEESSRVLTDIEKQISSTPVTDAVVMNESTFKTTSEKRKGPLARAMYHNLPRWLIDQSMIISVRTSAQEINRVNLVQVFGRIPGVEMGLKNFEPEAYKKAIFIQGNFVVDDEDIKRHGLRAVILESPFDDPSKSGNSFGLSQHWARMKADHLFNGHLKTAGTITLHGVRWPICEGDNVQVRGVVYHIDAVSHTCTISANGNKTFITTLSVSNGILASSLTGDDKTLPAYPVHRTLVKREQNDLPGVTDIERNIKSNRTPDGERRD